MHTCIPEDSSFPNMRMSSNGGSKFCEALSKCRTWHKKHLQLLNKKFGVNYMADILAYLESPWFCIQENSKTPCTGQKYLNSLFCHAFRVRGVIHIRWRYLSTDLCHLKCAFYTYFASPDIWKSLWSWVSGDAKAFIVLRRALRAHTGYKFEHLIWNIWSVTFDMYKLWRRSWKYASPCWPHSGTTLGLPLFAN